MIRRSFVMAGLDPAIRSSREVGKKDVDARHKAGHDERKSNMTPIIFRPAEQSCVTACKDCSAVGRRIIFVADGKICVRWCHQR